MSHIFLPLLVVLVTTYQIHFFLHGRRSRLRSWEMIIGELHPIDHGRLLEAIEDCTLGNGAYNSSIYAVVGGSVGIRMLEQNARLMLELAVFAERWNDACGESFSEAMRSEALLLKSAILRVQMLHLAHLPAVSSSRHLVEAVASYNRMRACLLSMYASIHQGRLPALECAL